MNVVRRLWGQGGVLECYMLPQTRASARHIIANPSKHCNLLTSVKPTAHSRMCMYVCILVHTTTSSIRLGDYLKPCVNASRSLGALKTIFSGYAATPTHVCPNTQTHIQHNPLRSLCADSRILIAPARARLWGFVKQIIDFRWAYTLQSYVYIDECVYVWVCVCARMFVFGAYTTSLTIGARRI